MSRIEKGSMQDPGLNHRLQQRSRRSGFMIGLTMALTLAVCVGSFTLIYAQLEPVVSDFVSSGETEVPPTREPEVAAAQPTSEGAEAPAAQDTTQPTPEPTDEPQPTTEPTPEDDEFVPDYQIDSPAPVNLRAGPSVNNSGDPIVAVPVDAPLMYLDESQPSEDPAGDGLAQGQVWMKFRTENGEEGWIREIDVTEYTP
jgi:hypothetical protein